MTNFRGIWLLVILVTVSCKPGDKDTAVRKDRIIEDIRQQYAPDKRVAIFQVTVENGVLKGETNLPQARQALLDSLGSLVKADSLVLLKPETGLVNVSVCNLRSEPRHSAELATQSLLGTMIKVYKKQGGWYYVQTPDGYLGWLDDGAFVPLTPESLVRWQLAKKVVVKKSFDLVYADLHQTVLSDVVAGNILEAGDQIGAFRLVRFPDGRTGYLAESSIVGYEQFLELKEPLLDNILTTAHEMMGRPYLWGGTSGKGMDCSGFTKTVYYLNALELPRDASQQVNVGMAIETDTTLKNLAVGDLLFFGSKATPGQKERITHVAIYLGDGKIIHASDRVQIQSLRRGETDFAENRLMTLVRAKRMLENIGENGVRKLEDHPLYHF